MLYNKALGNDGLSKELQETFGNEIKDFNSRKEVKEISSLDVSQTEDLTNLLEKKDRYKWCIENWNPDQSHKNNSQSFWREI